ncbi:MAG: hypothetical protein HY767_04145 [Candidatus Omnitrophica bacterium]|nr:hypothetical protein [Candidatus Omnitrophota bacterium]
MTQAGTDADAPQYHWASISEPDINYGLALNLVNDAIQLTVSKTTRMSIEFAKAQTGLIQDASDKEDFDTALAKTGVVVYRTLSDGESSLDGDAANPVYSFADPENPDKNYTVAVNAYVPAGVPDAAGNYSSFTTEATVTISTRISRAQVEQHIQSDANGEWIQDPEKKAQALASLKDGEVFSMTQAGTDDDAPQYQWASISDPDINYSMQVREDWHQSNFSRAERVPMSELQTRLAELTTVYNARRTEIAAEIATITAENPEDPRLETLQAGLDLLDQNYATQNGLLEAAITDGELVYKSQAGDADHSYQWSSKTERGTSYSLSVNNHVPVGEPDADGHYASFRTEFSMTTTRRVSIREIDEQSTAYSLIQDPAQIEAIQEAIQEPALTIFKSITDGKEPVYQWTSTLNSAVSYSISYDTHMPTGLVGAEMTVANFTRSERVSRAAMIEVIGLIRDPEERQNAQNALADGDNFSKSVVGAGDENYSWASFSDPTIGYSITVDIHAERGREANFKKSTRISEKEIQALTATTATVTVPSGVTDNRFSETQTIRDLLLGDLANDPNWDDAVLQLVEGLNAEGTLDWTGYSVTSEDGLITRIVTLSLQVENGEYGDLDPTTTAIDRIQYIETTQVSEDAEVMVGYTAQEVFGSHVNVGDWPVSHVTVSLNSFSEGERSFSRLRSSEPRQIQVRSSSLRKLTPEKFLRR